MEAVVAAVVVAADAVVAIVAGVAVLTAAESASFVFSELFATPIKLLKKVLVSTPTSALPLSP